MSDKYKKILNLLFVVIITIVSAYVVYPNNNGINIDRYGIKYVNDLKFRLGLDLQGGSHLSYQADLSDVAENDKASAMLGVRDVIERRVNAYGVAEPLVQVSQGDRLIVELAGIKDVNQAIQMIGETPLLEFKEEMTEEEKNEIREQFKDSAIPEEYLSLFFFKNTNLNGRHLNRADVYYDSHTFEPEVQLQFNDEGKVLFGDITSRNVGRRVAIFLDGMPVSAPPTVRTPITDGKAVISGHFTVEEAKVMTQRLNAGALPVPINLLSQKTVDASLGHDSVMKSLVAGIIGFVLLCFFMTVYYRLQGILAVLALMCYVLISLALFKLIPITLTLAGIAGFILSVGMAVDANVLIFERIKEELRAGRTVSLAIDEGFNRAWSAVFDSNLTTLISCFVLAYFGTSFIRGFAITLSVGVLVSMFSAVFITKILLKTAVSQKVLQHKWLFGVKNN